MKLLNLFSRKKPEVSNTVSTSRSVYWGGSTSGIHVNEMTAMQTAAVYASS